MLSSYTVILYLALGNYGPLLRFNHVKEYFDSTDYHIEILASVTKGNGSIP